MTRHYLNQWWLIYRRIYASLGLNELIFKSVSVSIAGNQMALGSVFVIGNHRRGCPRRHLKSNTCVRRNFKHTNLNLFRATLIKNTRHLAIYVLLQVAKCVSKCIFACVSHREVIFDIMLLSFANALSVVSDTVGAISNNEIWHSQLFSLIAWIRFRHIWANERCPWLYQAQQTVYRCQLRFPVGLDQECNSFYIAPLLFTSNNKRTMQTMSQVHMPWRW